jgi:hypothetical protein
MRTANIVLTAVLILFTALAHASDNASDIRLIDASKCEGLSKRSAIAFSDYFPKTFRNVKGIYFLLSKSSSEKLSQSSFSEERLEFVSGCLLSNFSNIPGQKRVPVFAVSRVNSIALWPEAKIKGNLIVWVKVGYREGMLDGKKKHEDVISLSVSYFRPDVHDPDELENQCAEYMPDTENDKARDTLLISALTRCLGQYYTQGPELPAWR